MAKQQRFRDVKQGKGHTVTPKNKKSYSHSESDTPLYASIGTKIKAFITDTFMLTMPIVYAVIYFVMGGRDGFEANMLQGWLMILIPHFIIVFLFFWRTGETPGCRAYAIELVDSQTGEAAHPLAIALRYYFELLAIVSVAGVMVSFFRKDRKGLHDLLSGTMLVESHKQTALER